MNKKIHVLRLAAVAVAGILLTFALGTPKVVDAIYDKSTLHRMEYQETSLKAYEVSYDSFAEKLHAIARCNGKGEELHSVVVQEFNSSLSDEDLTEIVNQEITSLMDNNILPENLSVSAEQMKLREMYTLYTAEEAVQGIRYWKLCYGEEGYEVTVYLDTEFYKIYSVEVMTGRICETDTFISVVGSEAIEKELAEYAEVLDDTFVERAQGWAEYWKLKDCEEYREFIMVKSNNVFCAYLDEDNFIMISEKFVIRQDKYGCIRRGIDNFADMTQL